MDWRNLKVGQVLWYVNTSPPDYDSPCPSDCLELWRGIVESIDPSCHNPVSCKWDRIGGYANWVAPEHGWYRARDIRGNDCSCHVNEQVYPTAKEAIEAYLLQGRQRKRATLEEQARRLGGTGKPLMRVLLDNY